MKVGWKIRKLMDFEILGTAVMEAAIFVSYWRHNNLITYAKFK